MSENSENSKKTKEKSGQTSDGLSEVILDGVIMDPSPLTAAAEILDAAVTAAGEALGTVVEVSTEVAGEAAEKAGELIADIISEI